MSVMNSIVVSAANTDGGNAYFNLYRMQQNGLVDNHTSMQKEWELLVSVLGKLIL